MENISIPTEPAVPSAQVEKPKPADPATEPPPAPAASTPVPVQAIPPTPTPEPIPALAPPSTTVPAATPDPATTATSPPPTLPTLRADVVQQIQPYAVVAGVLLALIYGYGWLAQYQANLALGIGPVYPTKETAVGTGIGCLLHVVMGVWFGFRYLEFLRTPLPQPLTWKAISSDAFQGFLLLGIATGISLFIDVFLAGSQEYTNSPVSAMGFWMLLLVFFRQVGVTIGTAVSTFLLLGQVQKVRESPSRNSRLLYILPGFAWIVAMSVMPTVLGSSLGADVAKRQAVFGGYCVTPVSFWSETDKSEKRGLLLVSSQDYAVVARFDTREQFWAAFERRNDKPLPLYKLRLDKVNYFSSGDAPVAATMPKPASTATATPTPSPSATPTPAVKLTPATIPLARK